MRQPIRPGMIVKAALPILLVLSIGTVSASTAQGGDRPLPGIYVLPTGDDTADGHSLATAFRSLDRAEAAMLAGDTDTVYIGGGTFNLVRPFTIKPLPRPQRWLAAPGARPVIDGGGRIGQALVVTGHNVTVEGLRITNFASNGIVVGDADGVVIKGNRISNIASGSWTTAAILVIQVGRNVTVENNVIDSAGYVGIGYFASEAGDLSGARILRNHLANTCRKVADCGAIYISGRTSTARGAIIRGNHITDYGPPGNETKAIYLDDGLSDADVSHNVIGGTGSYAVHVHGGSNNRIVANIMDLPAGQPVLFHQEIEGKGARRMSGNVLTGNIIHAAGGRLNIKYGGLTSRAVVGRNRLKRR